MPIRTSNGDESTGRSARASALFCMPGDTQALKSLNRVPKIAPAVPDSTTANLQPFIFTNLLVPPPTCDVQHVPIGTISAG
jgi:hypothetical protein